MKIPLILLRFVKVAWNIPCVNFFLFFKPELIGVFFPTRNYFDFLHSLPFDGRSTVDNNLRP
jgi:hypothetical protein